MNDTELLALGERVYTTRETLIQKLIADDITEETLSFALEVVGLFETFTTELESRHTAKDARLAAANRVYLEVLRNLIRAWPLAGGGTGGR